MNRAPASVFTTGHFLHNLQMCPISYSITSDKSGKVCQGQTLQLSAPIFKLCYKWCVVNKAPGSIITTILHNLQMFPISNNVTRVERCARDKHSSLVLLFLRYVKNDVLWIQFQQAYSQPIIFFTIYKCVQTTSFTKDKSGKVCQDKHPSLVHPFLSCVKNDVLGIKLQGA